MNVAFSSIDQLGQAARAASEILHHVPEKAINAALRGTAQALRENEAALLDENAKDVTAAKDKNLAPALIDRLTLNHARIEAMAAGLEQIAGLPDPVGKILESWTREDGLHFDKVAVPLGVLGMIYESRPNVTIDAAGLCLKSRNTVILRGGSESFNSSRALFEIMNKVLQEHNFPAGTIGMVMSTDRELVGEMLGSDKYIDVMIPRGGKGLIERVRNEARMPVFSHLDGICHVYVHHSANPAKALSVVMNSKMRRTGICGAAETLLIDKALPEETARQILASLNEAKCAIVGDETAMALDPNVTAATEEDWGTEYLDAKISVRFVSGCEEAVSHINKYGSQHTDSIIAEDMRSVEYFLSHVNSAIAMHNASTQFADGGEFGMGAEIGISTGKFHARGPVGVQQLTTYKYLVRGNGHIRA
jgi:glutamate-5-semialdehyde dehydrogenase